MEKENRAEMENRRRPCFYEIFSSNLTSQLLRIPAGFLKHMEGRVSGSVSLRGPSGNVWIVELIHNDEGLFLGHGWPDFARDHLVECGDLLVFRYDGESCFGVQVFDPSACEKESAFGSVCGVGVNKLGGKRDRGNVEGEVAYGGREIGNKSVRGSCSNSEGSEGKYWEVGMVLYDKGGCRPDEEICSKMCQEATWCRGGRQGGSPSGNSSLLSRLRDLNGKTDLKMGAAIYKRVGKEDESSSHDRSCGSIFSKREKKVAESFISCFPYFVRIMKKFNISGSYTLNIPYQFSMEHLPNCKTEITLRTVKGACWTVNSVPTTRVHTSHTLCGGWMAFVRNNDIKMGDICIFELVRKFEMRVFILRVGNEGPENQSKKMDSTGVNAGLAVTPYTVESHLKKLQQNALKVCSKRTRKVELHDKKGFKKVQATAFSNHKRKSGDSNNGTTAQVGKKVEMVGLQTESGLRAMVARKEENTSGFPNFVRIMRKFNVSGSYTLKIPHKFSTAYLPNWKTEIVLRNLQGDSWTVNSVPDSKGRAVHTFCGGWMAFVRDNDIQIGDICMFELIGNHEMLVQISGVGRQFSDNHDGSLASQNLNIVEFSYIHPPS